MSRRTDEIARRLDEAMVDTLGKIGLDLLGRAQRDAPIEEGTLRGSGSSRVERVGRDGAQVVVTFSTPYAAKQHEETTYEHPRGGKAHYLSDPLKLMTPRYVDALQAAASAAIQGL